MNNVAAEIAGPAIDQTYGSGFAALHQFAADEQFLLITDERKDLDAFESAASWDAAVLAAHALGYEPVNDDPDVSVGPLDFWFLTRVPRTLVERG